MTAPAWERVKAVFEQALDLEPAARTAFVARSCADDTSLAAEVQGLLRAHERAGEFLDTSAELCAEPLPSLVGRRIGPYRLLDEVGRGGMGTVYRARREDETYLKDVALKLVPGTLASRALADRFRQERLILGRLEHPNIARLLDGGTTDDGQPYFAMEFVAGRPIDDHCRREGLDLGSRIELLRVVCGAVAYAHRNLVVHRDIKARNVLVTAEGTPKLLDFGIAKLLAPDEAEAGALTQSGLRPMTPECASPEQVLGHAITTAADVYALGVLLYQLLTDARPYELAGHDAAGIVRVVCHQEPPPPSQVVDASRRRRLEGDLDTIVLTALRKEPERRYASVDELSDDLRRHLAGEPVRARKDSLRYRAGKFLGRNRGPVAAAVVVVTSLVAGLGLALQQARVARANGARAEARSRDAQRLANSLVFELHDAIADVPGATRARGLLLQRAVTMLDTLSADTPGDPVLAEDVAAAYHRLGEVLAGPASYTSLGDTAAALSAQRKGLALRERLAAAAPDDEVRQLHLVESHILVSYGLRGGEAAEHARQAVEGARRLQERASGDLRYTSLLARALHAAGTAAVVEGDLRGATAHFQGAAAAFETLLAADPADADALNGSSLVHRRLGAILAKQGRVAEALVHYRTVVPREEARVARDPRSVDARAALAISLVDLGWALEESDRAGAIEDYRRALAIREDLYRADPANVQIRGALSSVLRRLAAVIQENGEHRRALELCRRATAILGADTTHREQWGAAHRIECVSLVALRRWREALESARTARATYASLLAADPSNAWLKLDLARTALGAGPARLGLAAEAPEGSVARAVQRREAEAAYREALRLVGEVEAAGQLVAGDRHLLDEARAGVRRATAR